MHNNASFKCLAGERGECIKKVKKRLRSRVKNDLLEALMHASIKGPAVSSKEESQIFDTAVKGWNQVPRRKLPKAQHSTPMHVTSVPTSDAQVN